MPPLLERPLQRSPSGAGFALIEMVIAASILMIGALGFLQLFTAAADLNGANREGGRRARGRPAGPHTTRRLRAP